MDPEFKPKHVEFKRKILEERPTKEYYRDIRYLIKSILVIVLRNEPLFIEKQVLGHGKSNNVDA